MFEGFEVCDEYDDDEGNNLWMLDLKILKLKKFYCGGKFMLFRRRLLFCD